MICVVQSFAGHLSSSATDMIEESRERKRERERTWPSMKSWSGKVTDSGPKCGLKCLNFASTHTDSGSRGRERERETMLTMCVSCLSRRRPPVSNFLTADVFKRRRVRLFPLFSVSLAFFCERSQSKGRTGIKRLFPQVRSQKTHTHQSLSFFSLSSLPVEVH